MKHITKSYGSVVANDDVSLHLNEGEILTDDVIASCKAVADAIASGELVLEMTASEDDYTFPIF